MVKRLEDWWLSHLAVVSPQVEVDSLRRAPVPSAVAGGESDPDDPPPVSRGEPALFVVAPTAHGLLLLALGHAALPGQAQDIRVAAENGAMLHRRKHPSSSDRGPQVVGGSRGGKNLSYNPNSTRLA